MAYIKELPAVRTPSGEKLLSGYECTLGPHPPVILTETQLWFLQTLVHLTESGAISYASAVFHETMFVLSGVPLQKPFIKLCA